ncbi:MAG: MerR family transcriptional regulator [Lachnospiraceae bacterium]|nr:MerR family transcriptional regulator [Lachnospiraceae bacterium]
MRINDLEALLGVPRANIYYYEKEGLFSPNREENGYRSYSQEDLEKLRKIIALRKLGVSINDITALIDGTASLQVVLEENIQRLKSDITDLQGALKVCEEIRSKDLGMQSINGEELLSEIEGMESQGMDFSKLAGDILDFEVNTLLGRKEDPYEYRKHKGTIWKQMLVKFLIPVGAAIILCGFMSIHQSDDFQYGIRWGLKCAAILIAIDVIGIMIAYFIAKKSRKASNIFLWIVQYGPLFIINLYRWVQFFKNYY